VTQHSYELTVAWIGNLGTGTSGYRSYSRDCQVLAEGRETIQASSDPQFRGDPARWNPEQLLLASISQCHLLWFLHLAAEAGVVVTDYVDSASAVMVEHTSGAGEFTAVTLHPRVTVVDPDHATRAQELHEAAGRMCFVTRSVNFPVHHESTIVVDDS
jgi:organic hydroperoxide reductase OsmC/OhrA